jgi:triacylglycerol lipase
VQNLAARKVILWLTSLMLGASIWAHDAPKPGDSQVPVLLVRGLASRNNSLRPLKKSLREHGIREIEFGSYEPYLGEKSVKHAAEQIAEAVKQLLVKYKAKQVDIVGFSMGALSARYYIQRLGGKEVVRKFISISGPHKGTYTAYLPQFLTGIIDMRPNSELINDLGQDADPWGKVLVYSFYTPYDLIVIPASSGILPGSVEVKSYQVALHHLMLKDTEVMHDVARVLMEPVPTTSVKHVE